MDGSDEKKGRKDSSLPPHTLKTTRRKNEGANTRCAERRKTCYSVWRMYGNAAALDYRKFHEFGAVIEIIVIGKMATIRRVCVCGSRNLKLGRRHH